MEEVTDMAYEAAGHTQNFAEEIEDEVSQDLCLSRGSTWLPGTGGHCIAAHDCRGCTACSRCRMMILTVTPCPRNRGL